MIEIIFCLIIGVVIWSALGFILVICSNGTLNETNGFEYVNPKWIWEHYQVNIFGCLCLSILFNLLNPLGTICYWFYKLCTVGRK